MDETLRQRGREAILRAVAVCPHDDADGLASGATALRARGESADAALLLPRGVSPFSERANLPQGLVALLDQGVRPVARPAVYVDHHAPEFAPGSGHDEPIVVSGHGEGSPVSTAVLMRRLFPEQPSYLAAVGGVGDYGDAALALPECAGVTKTHVKKLVSLVNAPRRCPGGPVRTALALLVEHDTAKAALADPRVRELEDAKAAYRAAFDKHIKTAPRVAGDLALIRFASPYQIHPLIAQTWLRRLSPKVVMSANDGYIAGRTNFAVRGGPEELDLRAMLMEAYPEGRTGGHEFAHGHRKATGGSLPTGEFDAMLARLGF